MLKKYENRKNILVYVAGPLSDNECEYIKNVHKNIQAAIMIKKLGFSYICPSLDLLVGIMDGCFDYKDYANNSMELMKRCDVLYLGEGWENSKGCLKELEEAKKLNMFICEDLDILTKYSDVEVGK